MRSFPILGLALLVVLTALGCSGEVSFSVGGKSPEDAAEDRIEQQDFIDRVGQGPLTAECNDPGNVKPGDTFLCTAETQEGETVQILTTVVDEDTINVKTQNVLSSPGRESLETAAVESLNQQNDLSLTPELMSCGGGTVVLDGEMQMLCGLTNPSDGKVYDALVTVTNIESGAFNIDVSSTPRS